MKAIRHLIEWYWLISLPLQMDETLREASTHLAAFNLDKSAFAKADCSMAIPKIHSLQHYHDKIRTFGTPDNFDTEYTENKHITDVKQVYQLTNKIDFEKQMVMHVCRRMALVLKQQYLEAISMGDNACVKQYVRKLGSRAPKCPTSISFTERQYGLKDLEYCIRAYIHNYSYTEGNGKRHRVKKRNLPQLYDPQVYFILLMLNKLFIIK
jgi:hypothetical protein